MLFSSLDYLPLLIIVPALVTGAVATTLAFLLARWKGQPALGSFGWLTLALALFGAVDGLQLVSPWLFDPGIRLAINVLEGLLIGLMAYRFSSFVSTLTGKPWPTTLRFFFLLPLGLAAVLAVLVVVDPAAWSVDPLQKAASLLLLSLFGVVLACGVRLVSRWKHVHDRVLRRVLMATGILVVAFVPLWIWDALGSARLHTFYLFLLFWNLGALGIATKAFFEPSSKPSEELFSEDSLARCAARFGLTRETEVARLHAQGLSAKDISQKLSISPKTVRNHITNLYAKTDTGHRGRLLILLRTGSPG